MPGRDHGAADDLSLLIDAAFEAGHIARRHFRANPETWDKADGAGPVTEADLEVDRMLRARLLKARPDYGWLSEETEDAPERLMAERVFIIDPIDGTKAFIEGTSAFSHSLAVVENGQVIAAAVYLPIPDKMYGAALGGGTTLNGSSVAVRQASKPSTLEVLATRPTMTEKHWPRGVPEVERVYRPSLAYRMALVGEGRFDAMATFRPTWEWDIAAGALIISEAGGRVTDGHGTPLTFNNATPQVAGVLAGSPAAHATLSAHR